MTPSSHPLPRTLAATLNIVGEVIGLLMQLLLVWLGVSLVWGDSDEAGYAGFVLILFLWCIIATVYLSATAITLSALVRLNQPDPPFTRRLVAHPVTRVFSMALSFSTSLLGLTVAIDLITALGRDEHDAIAEAGAVWAMLLAWVIFNWGYARIYFSRYHRAKRPPLKFPGTTEPRLVDFAYFAFTNATTFSVSDVRVVDAHMRWTVVWHTTLAFFFNALIIALAMNVISNGTLFANILDALDS